MFCEEMIELFHKIPDYLPKPADYKKKQQMVLTHIGDKWLMEKHKSRLTIIKNPKLSKEAQNNENHIKKYL